MSMVPASLAFKAFDHPPHPQKYGLNLKSPLMPPVRSGEKEHLRVSFAGRLLAAPPMKCGSVDGEEKRSAGVRASEGCAGGR